MKSTIQSLQDSIAEQSKHMALTIKAMDGLKRTLKEFQVPVYTWEHKDVFQYIYSTSIHWSCLLILVPLLSHSASPAIEKNPCSAEQSFADFQWIKSIA